MLWSRASEDTPHFLSLCYVYMLLCMHFSSLMMVLSLIIDNNLSLNHNPKKTAETSNNEILMELKNFMQL